MRYVFIYSFIFVGVASVHCQKVFVTAYKSQADVILYKTKHRSEADIVVYPTKYAGQADPTRGLWHEVKYRNRADWVVYWTKNASEGDCKVYFVKYRSASKKNICYLEQ